MASQLGYDPQSYLAQIQARLAELKDFFHTTFSKSACSQKLHYDQLTKQPAFAVGNPVWLSIPTAGNLILGGKGNGLLKL